jgi:hypothetical protein
VKNVNALDCRVASLTISTVNRNMERAGAQDKVAVEMSGHETQAIFSRYSITDESNIGNAASQASGLTSNRRQAERGQIAAGQQAPENDWKFGLTRERRLSGKLK